MTARRARRPSAATRPRAVALALQLGHVARHALEIEARVALRRLQPPRALHRPQLHRPTAALAAARLATHAAAVTGATIVAAAAARYREE